MNDFCALKGMSVKHIFIYQIIVISLIFINWVSDQDRRIYEVTQRKNPAKYNFAGFFLYELFFISGAGGT